MPPGGGHYRPNTGSNPYNNLSGPAPHQLFQHQNANFHSQNFGGHPGFTSSHSSGNANMFGSGLANGSMSSNFNGGGSGLGGIGGTGLASQEAQLRFAHGAALQQQHGQDGIGASAFTGKPSRIREVWKHNLEPEMRLIRDLVDRYPYVSMDTEFPGIVARPMGNASSFPTKADYHYQTLRCNVDLLKLIQLGITFFSPEGDLPPQSDTSLGRPYPNNLTVFPCTWTFNFRFNLNEDMCSEDSINMLKRAGVDFDKCAESGIDHDEFGSVLQTSGLVMNPDVHWLSFHSGYDFGYLLKIMFPKLLPRNEEHYLELIRAFFPKIWDIKFLFRHAQNLARTNNLSHQATNILNSLGTKSGLSDLAEELGCHREGRPHTAGSDSWLTGLVFWQMKQKVFDGQIPEELMGQIWGLVSVGPPASAALQAAVLAGHQTPNTNGSGMYGSGMTPTTNKADGPSTPASTHTGVAGTPGPHPLGYAGGMGGIGAGGVFGNFQYGGR